MRKFAALCALGTISLGGIISIAGTLFLAACTSNAPGDDVASVDAVDVSTASDLGGMTEDRPNVILPMDVVVAGDVSTMDAVADTTVVDDTPNPPPIDGAVNLGDAFVGTRPVFVAVGYVGRSTISCDLGRTWVANRSDDDALRCYSNGNDPDCDHLEGNGRAIESHDGAWVAAYGWGTRGSLRRTVDGMNWTRVVDAAGATFSGIGYGNGTWLAIGRNGRSSMNGTQWSMPFTIDLRVGMTPVYNIRRGAYAEGVFVATGDAAGGNDTQWSSDGMSWQRPMNIPSTCGSNNIMTPGGIVGGNGTIVMIDSAGHFCASNDRARTWTATNINGTISGRAVFNGREFMTWGRAQNRAVIYRSRDGVHWTTQDTFVRRRAANGMIMTTNGPDIGASAFGNNAYVAVNSGFRRWYDQQEFYRSEDGVTWDVLAAGTHVKSHQIHHIAFGTMAMRGPCSP